MRARCASLSHGGVYGLRSQTSELEQATPTEASKDCRVLTTAAWINKSIRDEETIK